jgi:hypothetical protein
LVRGRRRCLRHPALRRLGPQPRRRCSPSAGYLLHDDLIWLALKFRWLLGAWLIAAGIALNLLPIAAHEGLMPVAYETIRDSGKWPEYTEGDIGSQVANSKDVILWRDDIRFEPLSDRYVVTIPGYGPNIYSIGDFIIFGGVALAAFQLIYLTFRPEPARTKADNGGVL